MNVSLFVPCYVDQLAPDVAWATLRVLERAGCHVHYDPEQGCCGQPFLNRGARGEARRLASQHLARFGAAEAIVSPSASCVATVRHRYAELGACTPGDVRAWRTYELSEFLVRRLGKLALGARFPYRVAVLQSCHGLRELGLGTPSERGPGEGRPEPSPAEQLLRAVEDLTLVAAERPDECCGFGGAFSVTHPTLSGRMGRARLRACAQAGAEYVTSTDVS